MLVITAVEQVLVDRGGVVWNRVDLRCPLCGWTDVDFVTNLTPGPSPRRRGEKIPTPLRQGGERNIKLKIKPFSE